MPVSVHKKIMKIQKNLLDLSSGKVPTEDCSADLLLGDSAFLLCCSEYRTRSRNSATVLLIFKGFVDINVCFSLLCMSWDFRRIYITVSLDRRINIPLMLLTLALVTLIRDSDHLENSWCWDILYPSITNDKIWNFRLQLPKMVELRPF